MAARRNVCIGYWGEKEEEEEEEEEVVVVVVGIMQETRIRFSARVRHMPGITKDHCQVTKTPLL